MVKLKKSKKIFIIFCIIAALGCGFILKNRMENDKQIDNFIKENYSSIDIYKQNCVEDFSILDDDMKKYDIFLAGEGHAIKKNFDIKLELLKYFNQKGDIKYLLCESGYSSSALMNKYLETGNEDILNDVYNELKGTAAWSKEGYEFWKELRKYNMTLPDNKKIIVIGIDIEHQIKTALDYLYSILPNNVPSDNTLSTIENFKKMKNNIQTEAEVQKIIKLLQDDIKANQNDYEEYLGNNFFDFDIVVDNIINSINAYNSNDSDFNVIREKSIYSNFTRVYSHLPKGKYFGQWGLEHVYQKDCDSYLSGLDRFAMCLNKKDSPVKGKILSIAYGYKDCFRRKWGKNYKEVKTNSNIDDMNIIDKYGDTDITLFKLTGEKSPLNNKLYFVQKPNGGVTTDYFQYIVLLRDSKGTTPFRELE